MGSATLIMLETLTLARVPQVSSSSTVRTSSPGRVRKQKVVALSSCEAEYIACTAAACQGVWLTRLLSELKGKSEGAVRIYIDSQSAIQLSKNPVFHDRSKHIDTRYHYIRECIEEDRVNVASVGTAEQLADILTKALARERFCELRDKLGLVKIK